MAHSISHASQRFAFISILSLTSAFVVAQTRPAKPGPPAVIAWKVPANAWARPAVDGDSVFFLSRQHDVTAVNIANGAVRWTQKTGEPDMVFGAGITVASGLVIAGDYNVVAFDRATGSVRWRFVPALGWAPGAYLGAAQNGVVYAGSGSGRIYAIDVLSGTARWTASLGDDGPMIVYEPVLSRDAVFATFARTVAPAAGGVVCLDAATGIERWRIVLPVAPAADASGISAGTFESPVVFENLIIAASRDGVVYALNRTDGAIAWTLPGLSSSAVTTPGVNVFSSEYTGPRADGRALAQWNRTLFVGSNTGLLIAYDLDTRREKWRYLADVNFSLAPQLGVDGQYLYVPSWTGRLAALNISNGTEHWRIGDYKNVFLWPPAVAGGVVYATSSTGLYALRR